MLLIIVKILVQFEFVFLHLVEMQAVDFVYMRVGLVVECVVIGFYFIIVVLIVLAAITV